VSLSDIGKEILVVDQYIFLCVICPEDGTRFPQAILRVQSLGGGGLAKSDHSEENSRDELKYTCCQYLSIHTF
jgi:hypothetical protein